MDEVCIYQIIVHDGFDENAFNATSPLPATVVGADSSLTLLIVHADQSGLVGLLRHLHQQGYMLLSIYREPQNSEEQNVYKYNAI